MAPKKMTSADPCPSTHASAGSSGTSLKPTPQGGSRAKATPALSSTAKGGKNTVKGPGLTIGEEKLLKDLAQKKKKVAEDVAEAKKKGKYPRIERLSLT